MSKQGHNTISAGREAWLAYKEAEELTLDRLLVVGAALLEGRRWALEESGARGPTTLPYRKAFSAWCDANGFGDVPTPWRTNLLWCAENANQVRAFYTSKAAEQKRGRPSVHPGSIRGRMQQEAREGGPRPKRVSPIVGSMKVETLARMLRERFARLSPEDVLAEVVELAGVLETAASQYAPSAKAS